jgi:Protein of unknown function (DUF2889)
MAIQVPVGLKPRGSVRSAPARRPGSVRRTATMDFTWPDGMAGNTVLDGRARDLSTDNDGNATVLAQASLGVVSDTNWIITEISSSPGLPGLPALAGLAGLAGESAMCRARRIDVWADGTVLHVDAFFQDSSTLPEGGRQSIHEYTLTAQADLEAGTLRAVHPVPRVQPYGECPLAVKHVGALAGLPLRDLRGAVLERLRGPLGCTHLNDMLRALAAVPALARNLPSAGGSKL